MKESVTIKPEKQAYLLDARVSGFQKLMQIGYFNTLPTSQVFVAYNDEDLQEALKLIIVQSFKAVYLCGNDYSLGKFLNIYRQLLPNPSRLLYIGLIGLGAPDFFFKKFSLHLPKRFLLRAQSRTLRIRGVKFLECEGQLAPYISAGNDWRAMSQREKLKLSLKESKIGLFFSQPLSASYAVLCTNDAPIAYKTHKRFLIQHYDQEEVLLQGRTISAFACPNPVFSTPQATDFFQLHFNLQPRITWALQPLQIKRDSFLCQRIRLEASPEIPLVMPGLDAFIRNHATITLSQREFPFLIL